MLDQAGENPIALPPEGRRVLRRFALAALAGARAAAVDVIDWTLPEIIFAIKHVRDRWLSEQGSERSETDRGLAHLRDQLIASSDRFRWIKGGKTGNISNILGYRVPDFFLLNDRGLLELCGEFDKRTLLSALKNAGHLWHDKDRLTRKSPRIEELGNARPNLYWISVAFIGEVIDQETEEDGKTTALKDRKNRTGDLLVDEGEQIPF